MKVSIITPTYNSEKFVKDTLISIEKQIYPDIEHIICDNMSTDKTSDICSNYVNIFDQRPDSSLYEALNRGIQLSTGDILCFLNSDDLYPDSNTIDKVVTFFKRNPEAEVLYGKCGMVDRDLKYLYTHKPIKKINFSYAIKRVFTISHPTVFIKKNIFKKYGFYDLNLKYMSDCEYWIRLLHQNVSFKYFDVTIALFRRHDNNLSLTNQKHSEIRYILNKYNYKISTKKTFFYILYDNIFNYNYIRFLFHKYLEYMILYHKKMNI